MVSDSRYIWRQLGPKQREELLSWRRERSLPWHSPPHRENFGQLQFLLTAACYEHRPCIGYTTRRMEDFSKDLLENLSCVSRRIFAWCVLPNHYHVLVETSDIMKLLGVVGRFHGRTSYAWNGQENLRGRKVFFRAVERSIRSDRHFWATMNYIHHNPVHHGYVMKWTEWPWSSAKQYLQETDPVIAKETWRQYPIADYGRKWDKPDL